MQLWSIVLLGVVLAMAALVFRQPQTGVLLASVLPFVDTFQRLPGAPEISAALVVGVVTLFAWLGTLALGRTGVKRRELNSPILFFVIWTAINPAHILHFRDNVGLIISRIGFCIFYFIICSLVHDRRFVKRFILISSLVITPISILGVYQSLTGEAVVQIVKPRSEEERIAAGVRGMEVAGLTGAVIHGELAVIGQNRAIGLSFNPNTFAFFLGITIVLSTAYLAAAWTSPTERRVRRWLMFSILCGLGALLCTQSVAAYIALAGATLFVAAVRRNFKIIVAGVVVVAVALVALPAWFTRDTGEFYEVTVLERVLLTSASLNMIAAHPIAGVGLSEYLDEIARFGLQHRSASHSDVLDIAGSLGLVGLVGFVWIVIRYFSCFRRALRACRLDSDRALLIGFAACVVNVLIFGLSHTVYGSANLWILLGLSVALFSVVDRRQRPTLSPTVSDVEVPA